MHSFMIRLTVIVAAFSAASAAPDVFDKPIDTKVIALPKWDKFNTQAKPNRTCFYYPSFVVKQIDLGEIGADTQSVTAIAQGSKAPDCSDKIKNEVALNADSWQGYFKGAKGEYLFFDNGDSLNGGLPFLVFSAQTGKKLFEDTREDDGFKSIAVVGGALVMHYRRVYFAACSIMADPTGCWRKVMQVTGLPESAKPDCIAAYQKETARTPNFAADIPKLATMVGYNVEARYAGGKLVLKPVGGPVTCWLES